MELLNEMKQAGNMIIDCFTKKSKEINKIDNITDFTQFLNKELIRQSSILQRDYIKGFIQVCKAVIKGKISEEVFNFYLETQFLITPKDNRRLFESLITLKFFDNKLLNKRIIISESNLLPKINVIITTYNREKFLHQVIESILNQDYSNIEIIVIDDNSQDGTSMLMEDKYSGNSKVIYMRNKKNEGPGTNRLKAFTSHADGDYILFLDDDDYLIDSNYISKAIDFHQKNPNVSFVAANVFFENTETNALEVSELNLSKVVKRYDYFINFEKEGYPKPASTLTTVFKRRALIEMDILNMKMVNDSSIYLRSLLVGDAGFLDSIAGVYRIHGNNITFNLKSDFIIQNLQEKMIIRNMAIDNFGYESEEVDKWYNNSVYVTVSYFLKNSAKNKSDYKVMLDWTKENCKSIYNNLRLDTIKIIMKKILYRFPIIGKKGSAINVK
ncbi:glycosyltransferase family 2 protein [Niallia sp. Man26]|uniref:glycosyltransferase family 2 protein n=1 Tax=Niallia sp. Man26 TaxID=2912824 RepID=UPI001EDAD9DF|nr:glycosyltransferase family 2 protein [Niallia sp. Man26]UPO87334.1 glycosyltransferase [Niallia sp. Man26]